MGCAEVATASDGAQRDELEEAEHAVVAERRPGLLTRKNAVATKASRIDRRRAGDEDAEGGVAEAQALLVQRLRLAYARP